MAIITGTSGPDNLIDTNGNDTIDAEAGDDTINVFNGGTDSVDGDTGNDRLILNALLTGGGINMAAPTQNADGLSGSATWSGTAVSFQRIENFTIFSGLGNFADNVVTGGGDDIFHHYGINSLTYLQDFADLGGATDLVVADFTAVTSFAVTTSTSAVAPGYTLAFQVGGNGKLQLANVERVQFLGGAQGDNVFGLAGNDILEGRAGNDTLSGRDGDDVIDGGPGNDILNGEGGTDTLSYASATAGVTVNLGQTLQQDTIGAGLDTASNFENLTGSPHNDSLIGTLGVDNVIDGGAGADAMNGQSGNDTYHVDNAGDTISESSAGGVDTVITAIGDKAAPAYALYYLPANVEKLTGTSNAGQGVGGNNIDNTVTTGSGQDLIAMHQGGIDNVDAGAGADFIWFGDTLTADDVVNGGLGRDTLGIQATNGGVVLGANVTNIERIELYGSGGAFSFSLTLADSVNSPHPNFFEVVALSLTATEQLTFNGSAETDHRYFIRGGAGNDNLSAGAGNDRIVGNDGNDVLSGNGGNDVLVGGNGGDTYLTGDGADVIEVLSAAQSTSINHDTLAFIGFDPSVDRVNVSGNFAGWASAVIGVPVNQASFDADVAAAVNGALGNSQAVRLVVSGGDQNGKTLVIYDADGDGSYTAGSDYVFQISGTIADLESHAIFI